jgi:hypothetical protein
LEHFSTARDILEGLTRIDPDNASRQRDLSIALERVGMEREKLGDDPVALAS